MHFSTINKDFIQKSDRFRTPLSHEKKIGLWVDRIGTGTNFTDELPFRILGLYGAVCVQSGEGFFESGISGKIPVKAGDTMILFPNEPHRYNPSKKWTTQWIVWGGPEALNLERIGFLDRESPIVYGNFHTIPNAFSALSQIMDNEDLASILERKNIVLNMLLELYKHSKSNGKRTPTDLLMEKSIEYIYNTYQTDISVPSIARYSGLSVSHFRRLFKAYTGRSPKEFILSLRISRAKEYLARNMNVKEIADTLGFRDNFYFMRIFKKYTGTSPGRFTKSYR